MSVCMYVCLCVFKRDISFSFPSDSKLTQPLPRYPMSPIHVSHARQSTGPPSQSTGPPSQSTGPPSQSTGPPNEPLNAKLCYSSVSDLVICF